MCWFPETACLSTRWLTWLAGWLSLEWSQTQPEWTTETQQWLPVFLERRRMKTYKGSRFCGPFCLLMLRPGPRLSLETRRTCLLRLTQEKLHWASHGSMSLHSWLSRRLLISQGVWLQSRRGTEKAESPRGRAGGPRPWVPATARLWLPISACPLWPLYLWRVGSRLGTAEGERAV